MFLCGKCHSVAACLVVLPPERRDGEGERDLSGDSDFVVRRSEKPNSGKWNCITLFCRPLGPRQNNLVGNRLLIANMLLSVVDQHRQTLNSAARRTPRVRPAEADI